MRHLLQRSLRLRALGAHPPAPRSYHASVLPSLISTATPEFQAKAKAMDELVHDLEKKLKTARQGGGVKAAERMRSKGKRLPRERSVLFLFMTKCVVLNTYVICVCAVYLSFSTRVRRSSNSPRSPQRVCIQGRLFPAPASSQA
jgi:hypothetical protein